jgi:type IV pilus assembly protein PilV
MEAKSIGDKGIRPAGQEGFTLLELLIATVILAIGLLGVAALQMTAIQGNAEGKNFTLASSLVGDKIDELRNGDFGDVTNQTDYITFNNKVPQVQDTQPGSGFFMTRAVDVSNGPVAGTVQVNVAITWQNDVGLTRRTEFETIIAN